MNKNQINKMPEYFERYINYVPESDIIDALQKYDIEYLLEEKSTLKQIGHQVYAPRQMDDSGYSSTRN
jgi:hypothetical protein